MGGCTCKILLTASIVQVNIPVVNPTTEITAGATAAGDVGAGPATVAAVGQPRRTVTEGVPMTPPCAVLAPLTWLLYPANPHCCMQSFLQTTPSRC